MPANVAAGEKWRVSLHDGKVITVAVPDGALPGTLFILHVTVGSTRVGDYGVVTQGPLPVPGPAVPGIT